VVKIGSGVLTSSSQGLDFPIIEDLVSQLATLQRGGLELLVVSSGAIAAGLKKLALPEFPKNIPQKQAAAAIGQSQLIWAYEKFFSRSNQQVAQILLTHDDLSNRRRYLNARNTLTTLLKYRVIPIINENDTVAVEEIQFGDNDTLSALVTNMVGADLLIILSDVDGFYTSDPHTDVQATLLSQIDTITPAIEAMAQPSSSLTGRGGMITKVQAAKKVGASGAMTIIANGKLPQVITRILSGEDIGTLFLPSRDRLASRKYWIAYTLKPKGELIVDEGAKEALIRNGKSLLPKGLLEVRGNFNPGDAVICKDTSEKEFARGLVNYSYTELEAIKGHYTNEIENILGYKFYDEVIHRDDLVLV
jgi:glutamate 5-kinase